MGQWCPRKAPRKGGHYRKLKNVKRVDLIGTPLYDFKKWENSNPNSLTQKGKTMITNAYVNPYRRNLHRELAVFHNQWVAAGNTVKVFPKGWRSDNIQYRTSHVELPFGFMWNFA